MKALPEARLAPSGEDRQTCRQPFHLSKASLVVTTLDKLWRLARILLGGILARIV